MWDDTPTRDRGLDKAVQLLVASDGKLQVPRGDSSHLEVFGRVSGQLENLSSEVLENSGAVDGGGRADSVLLRNTLLQESVDPADGELVD